MDQPTIPRYQVTYRQAELRLITALAKQGQSLCYVGLAGSGKSNITNFLHSDPYGYKAHYFGDQSSRFLFPVVDGNTWDRTPAGLWHLLRAALLSVTPPSGEPAMDEKLIQLSTEQRAFSELKAHVDWLCQKLDQRLVFILDDFDQVIQLGPLAMLEQLNALRSSGNRGKLSYLIFTKKLPHLLGSAHPLKGTSKFYDLFSNHIYALGLYNHADARQMLVHLHELAGKPLTTRDLAQIEALAGGHARLLRLLFEVWRTQRPAEDAWVGELSQQDDIRAECQRILRGLHSEEQAVSERLSQGQTQAADRPVLQHLERRGLWHAEHGWFSPLFAEFLRQSVEQPRG
ncbi:MAG: hypothetical protein KF832_00455 [Caldilineaceae bacterium]|nr:hypothetical protein [Caldilineaceae bacterium]